MRSGSDVTGAVYRRVLDEHLVSHDRAWYRNNLLLADDNARPHRACVVDAYPHEQDIFGTKLVVVLEELDPQSVNLRQLGVVIQNMWQQIPLERVQTLVSSMSRRVRALVDARGRSTRY